MFVIMTLATVGLPMLNGFVGEFLILSAAMQSAAAHHIAWTVVATTGVIFGAGYMLWMVQRIFYGRLGLRPEEVRGWDLCAREHVELWPFAALFLIMGVASPIWMKAIDTFSTLTADKPLTFEPGTFKHIESESYGPTAALAPQQTLPSRPAKDLSSRPERSAVERPAVPPVKNHEEAR
jgi:NADH-quinone oxidoreductase subunit M